MSVLLVVQDSVWTYKDVAAREKWVKESSYDKVMVHFEVIPDDFLTNPNRWGNKSSELEHLVCDPIYRLEVLISASQPIRRAFLTAQWSLEDSLVDLWIPHSNMGWISMKKWIQNNEQRYPLPIGN